MILDKAIECDLSQNQLIHNILILTDMNFELFIPNDWDSIYSEIKNKYKQYNYVAPNIISWNLRSEYIRVYPINDNVIQICGFSKLFIEYFLLPKKVSMNSIMNYSLYPYDVTLTEWDGFEFTRNTFDINKLKKSVEKYEIIRSYKKNI